MKGLKNLPAIFLVAAMLPACSPGSGKRKISGTENKNDTASILTNHYTGTGVVISIPPDKKMVVIRHGIIPGFMNAMTMPFNVADSFVLEGISPKDSVNLFIEYDGTTAVLKKLEKIK